MNKDYIKPNKFDRNLVVLGAGSAGLVTAYIAAAVKAKVSLMPAEPAHNTTRLRSNLFGFL